jgi:predicted esterase
MNDPLVQLQYGQMSSNILTRTDNTFIKYSRMGHETCQSELNDVSTFLNSKLMNGRVKRV